MIGHKRIPSREGGVEIVVEEISTRLAARGHTVHAYNRRGNFVHGTGDRYRRIKEYKGVKIIHVPTIPKKGLDALVYSFFAVIRALFGHYDAIHFHAEGPGVMISIARLFGIRTVSTIHGLDWKTAKWGGFAKKYILLGEKTIAKKADEVIVLSSNGQKYFLDNYGRSTNIIPNGVNRPEIRKPSIITEKYGLNGRDYLLYLGRIVQGKGLEYLIDAYKRMGTGTKLVIAGGSSHTDAYVEEIRERISSDSRIIMTGFVDGALLDELFCNCAVFVIPSDSEGMSMTLLEAMSYGCSCLVSDIPENTEVVEAYAETFIRSNTDDLQKKLEYMLAAGPGRHTPDEISAFILKKYNWDDVTERHLELYKNNKGEIQSGQ